MKAENANFIVWSKLAHFLKIPVRKVIILDFSVLAHLFFYFTDPFVDVFLVNSGKMIEHHCTKILLDVQSPIFNEGIEFYIPSHQIEESDLYLIAMHKYNRITNTLIGKVMIGSHSDGLYKAHWDRALQDPEKVIPMWHPITR